MGEIKVANSPCSWGVLEFDLDAQAPDHRQVLAEMNETGYVGTELGDWGFMPTDPQALHAVVAKHELTLVGAFLPVALADETQHVRAMAQAIRLADLLQEAGYPDAFIVLADDNGTLTERTAHAGRIVPAQGLTADGWQTFVKGAHAVAKAVKETCNMRTVFHHHGAGYMETVDELETFLSLTDPTLIGLCFDTGHYALGGGNPTAGIQKYYDRIWHVHIKDFDPAVAAQLAEKGWDYFDAVKQGIFCELGKGSVDFKAILDFLKTQQYQGWLVVEQDVLPGMGAPKVCAQHNRLYLHKLGI